MKMAIPIPHLPSEILTDIFLRLPLKSLSNVILVDKFFLKLITSPDFAKARLKISKQGNSNSNTTLSDYRVLFSTCCNHRVLKQFTLPLLLFSNRRSDDDVVVILDFPKSESRFLDVAVVGACDGLVCFVLKEKDVFVWNPCTDKYVRLPRIVFDKKKSCVSYGFGYDESTDDYKVVGECLFHDDEGSRMDDEIYHSEVHVFSLKMNSWKQIQDFKGRIPDVFMGKLVSGKVHWYREFYTRSRCDIVSFDMGSEVFGIVEQPSYTALGFRTILDVLDGCLCLLLNYEEQARVDVLVMKEYGVKESWTKLFTISCVDVLSDHDRFRPSSVLPNGEILFVSWESFAIYNLKDGSFRFPALYRDFTFEPVIYVQSLISPIA